MTQVKKAVHWTTVLAKVKEARSAGIGKKDLAKELGVDWEHEDFVHAIALCIVKGKISEAMGKTADGGVGSILTIVELSKRKRDLVFEDEEVEKTLEDVRDDLREKSAKSEERRRIAKEAGVIDVDDVLVDNVPAVKVDDDDSADSVK